MDGRTYGRTVACAHARRHVHTSPVAACVEGRWRVSQHRWDRWDVFFLCGLVCVSCVGSDVGGEWATGAGADGWIIRIIEKG